MIWAFLFALLLVIYALWRLPRRINELGAVEAGPGEEFGFAVVYLVCTLVVAVVAFWVGIGFALLIGLAVPKHWAGPETTQLVSLRDSGSNNERFFLGVGSIGPTQYYFYEETMKGYHRLGKVAVADNVAVNKEKRQGGELQVYTYQFVDPSLQWFARIWLSKKYVFVIPEDGLKKDFVLR